MSPLSAMLSDNDIVNKPNAPHWFTEPSGKLSLETVWKRAGIVKGDRQMVHPIAIVVVSKQSLLAVVTP